MPTFDLVISPLGIYAKEIQAERAKTFIWHKDVDIVRLKNKKPKHLPTRDWVPNSALHRVPLDWPASQSWPLLSMNRCIQIQHIEMKAVENTEIKLYPQHHVKRENKVILVSLKCGYVDTEKWPYLLHLPCIFYSENFLQQANTTILRKTPNVKILEIKDSCPK